jgi:hypothetical protein
MPDCIECTGLRPTTLGGSAISTRCSRAAREKSASALICTPGVITPPRYSPFGVTQSNVVAVPKSTTMTPDALDPGAASRDTHS